ncbi:DUF2793 domain-containing protein [Methyloceanibacter caenitepidi]|uniref:DUF2793 domain-containing protein n=1 Tax=Methyloceanibacter caenitepidi TaxID=1384459 RepID=A0A0A8K5D9_9HYPH|nr:DUF2793 domain-containing protein [Methyloceanibacter caenitepidi]BAQ17986.1 hypothetical protein GL4_2552 [Methyloceanibacter caenitepidi]
MTEESAKLRIPYIAAAQAQKHVTHNEAMTLLDTLVQLSVLDKDLLEPPASPAEGDCYIVAGGGGPATGAWIGWEKRVARYIDGEWRSYLPGEGAGSGWIAWVHDEDAMYRFDGSDWTLAGIEGPQGPQGPAYQPDAAVDAIAGRAAYDDEVTAFSVLVVSDSGNAGQPTLYFKLSAGSADWSAGITWLPQTAGPAFTVRTATTADIAIASGLNGGDVIDGVTLVAGELVLVKDQAAPAQNGIYIVGPSPTRVFGLSAYDQHPGALVTVQEGAVNADTRWLCTSIQGGTLGSTAITFSRMEVPPRGHLYGLILSNNATDAGHDIDVAVGEAASDDTTPALMRLTSALTKRADTAWAPGNGSGASLDSGALTANGTVHWWLISTGATVDVGCSDHDTSGLSPTLPSGYLYKQYIGSTPLDASSNIRPFVQTQDRFEYNPAVEAFDAGPLGTSGTNFKLPVPEGFRCRVEGDFASGNSGQAFAITVYATGSTPPDAPATAGIASNVAGHGTLGDRSASSGSDSAAGNARIWVTTNTTGQITADADVSVDAFGMYVVGYVCPRGRLAEAI